MNLWTYFKERKGFDRMLNALKDKYISLGRYSGTIELENVTPLEAKELSMFFGQKIEQGNTFKTSFSKIEKRLQNTIFEDFTWEELFSNYFGTHPISKAKCKQLKREEEVAFFKSLTIGLSDSLRDEITCIVEEKGSTYNIILKRYHKEREGFKKDISEILTIIDHLEDITPSTLPLIASRTGDPHFLDMNTQNNSLFIKILAKYKKIPEPSTNQEKINFLSAMGIGIDDLSNYAITYLLNSNTAFIKAFEEADEPLNINLHNMDKIDKLYTESGHVFIFENPSILTKLIPLKVPIIITSGNPNYVVFRLLDKLSASGVQLHYNGDFDPEGLVIAANLKRRYPEIDLFCYDAADYYESSPQKTLNLSRLKKLNGFSEPALQEIKGLIAKEKKCGYQENNTDRIKSFITNLVK